MLLAIDTSAGSSVALAADGRVLARRDEPGTRRHAEAIDALLRGVLADAGVDAAAVTGVVAGMGPGPFTGLRVGIAAARVFAFARGIPCHPVVSHDAIARGASEPVLVATDARRREVAWSRFNAAGERVEGPSLAERGDDWEAVVARFVDHRVLESATVDAGALALVAADRLARGLDLGPAEPLYLRAPDVTVAAP